MKDAKPRRNRPFARPTLEVDRPANSEVTLRMLTEEERQRLGEPEERGKPLQN
ncbi:hypothetical protein [Paenibacillus sp. L3-i20]|uniref:hypothetical protein n=1 Tax=Paenibacillus sp. L3-i20 TaxID=2905833 RepID=UPI001EDCC3D7|nr:hypothetical protein [Paenibacillus sp. L3-i20]GKU79804.1 hypothetical protein L3i20_v242010 [Paenibacillus sp. L3-i20]